MSDSGDANVALIGCGNISSAYLQLGKLFKGFKIVACADIDNAAAQARAQEYGIRAASVEDLLADEGIDCIVNLTIPAAHSEISCKALEAGKHVYSEKPLALSLADGKAIADLAKEKGLRAGCAPDTFMGGAHQLARQAIDDGQIGAITSGSCHCMSPGMESWHPNPDFFFQPGAGPILDIGPYYVANLVNLIGPIKRVVAMDNTPQSERTITSQPRSGEKIPVNTPTSLFAVLEFISGAKVTFTASWDVIAHRHANMELYGSKASLYVPDPNFFNGEVLLAGNDSDPRTLPEPGHPFAVANWDGGYANYRCAGLADMLLAQATGEKAHRCSVEFALHCLEVMLGIIESAAESAYVDIQTPCAQPAALDKEAAQAMLR